MSMHPNVILMVAIKPDDLSRKTFRAIVGENYDPDEGGTVTIGGEDYNAIIMEDEYYEGFQVSADEGDLVFLNMVTYGYGKRISWTDLEAKKRDLEAWAEDICKKHHASYVISVTANHW